MTDWKDLQETGFYRKTVRPEDAVPTAEGYYLVDRTQTTLIIWTYDVNWECVKIEQWHRELGDWVAD